MRTMAFSFSFLFLLLMASAAHAAVSPRDYWQSVLPDTTMPAAIRDPLQSDMDVRVQGINVEGLATVHTNKASVSKFYEKGVGVEGLTTTDIGKDRATNFYQKGVNVDDLATSDINRATLSNIYQKGLDMEELAPTDVDKTKITNLYQKRSNMEGPVSTIISMPTSNNFYQNGVKVERLVATNIKKAKDTNFYWKGVGKPASFHQKGVGLVELATTDINRARATNFYQKGVDMEGLATTNIGKASITNHYQKGVNVMGPTDIDINRDKASNIYQNGVDVEGLAIIDVSKARATNFYEKGINMEGMAATDISRASVTNFYQKGVTINKPPTHVKQTLNIADTFNFFLEKDLHSGTKMRLDFSRISPKKPFIPRGKANSIPFSSKNLSLILDKFFVKPNTIEARIISMTLQGCEEGKDSIKETKFCATSLESLVDLVTSALGSRNIMAISSEISKEGMKRVHEYIVATAPIQRLPKGRIVACHQQPYPYAVFYCHIMQGTRAYVMSLINVQDGVKVDAVAVCHTDTSTWNPNHLAFQVLKVVPGTLPICHFLPQDGVVWAPKGEALLPAVFEN